MITDSVRTDEGGQVKPRGSRTASTGSVVDPRSGKYPSTHEHASSEEANASEVNHGRMARRPSGHYRGSAHGFHTPNCTCKKHPCTCKTEHASAALAAQHESRKQNVNMC
jgi:hypothetical protein